MSIPKRLYDPQADPGVLQLAVSCFGWDDTGMKVEMRPRIPDNVRGDIAQLSVWVQLHLKSIVCDVKHTEDWQCCNCGQPAKETEYAIMGFLQMAPPKVMLFVYHLCDATPGHPCKVAVDKQNAELGEGLGMQPQNQATSRSGKYPLARTCGKCWAVEEGLTRCGRCKLMRYCGSDCQREDWPRHKVICKTVKSVEWHYPGH